MSEAIPARGIPGQSSTSILGNAVLRREDATLIRGRGEFVANQPFDDLLHAHFVRSTAAHGEILSVDVDDARSMPGVVAVYTSVDLGLEDRPSRLECFDISHTGGESPVASCVVFDEDGPLKSAYPRFNLTDVTPGDDYAAIRQAVLRRFRRLKEGEAPVPDVLLIDGGKGQLASECHHTLFHSQDSVNRETIGRQREVEHILVPVSIQLAHLIFVTLAHPIQECL